MVGSSDLGLGWFARRASADAFFLGRALAEYQAMHGIDDQKLAEMLRCTVETLARLALCRRPDDQAVKFREEVQRIAAFASCNAERLAQLLREVAAVASLRKEGSDASSQDLLMAARDRRSSGEPPKRMAADKKRSKREPWE